jgi:CBS domain-containing protein
MFTIEDLIREKGDSGIYSILPDATVYEALKLMADKNLGAVLVIGYQGELEGIFTERDYARKIILLGRTSLETTVQEIMTRDMVTIGAEETLEDAMELMTKYRIRHLPVLKDKKLIGLVSIRDVVQAVINHKDLVIEDLQNYILGKGYPR